MTETQEKPQEHSGSEMEAVMEERDEMERGSLPDKERLLLLELEKVKQNVQKEKERFELQWREREAREARMREEISALVKERDEMRRTFQADQDRLVLQLEELRRKTEMEEKRCDEVNQRQWIRHRGWIRHCDVLEQMILEKDQRLDMMTVQVDALEATVKELKRKACDMDPETVKELKEVDKRLKSFGPQWFQKLRKKNNIKTRQYLEKQVERLELQLRDCKAREARSTEVMNVLVKERVKMRRQLELDVVCTLQREKFNRTNDKMHDGLQLQIREGMAREASATEVINALSKERDDMKKRIWEKQDLMETELGKVREKMDEVKNKERFKLLKRERTAMEEYMVEKMNEQRRAFQAEEEQLEQMILGKDKILEMTEELEDSKRTEEAGKKEGLRKADKKLKRSPRKWFQRLWKKDIKKRQQMERVREAASD